VTVIYPRERAADPAFLRAVTNLALMTDAVERPGAGLMPLVRETNEQGAIDVGATPDANGIPGAEMLRAVADGRIKAMYVAGRELAAVPGALDALDKLDFLVVQDFALNETVKRAHVVLPGLTFAEKDGSYTNLESRVQRLRQALQIRGEGRPDWRIFRDVLNSLGGSSFVSSPDDVFKEIAAAVPRYGEMTFGKLGFKGIPAPYKAASYELVP
jgi:formate dehydrogenase major subunit